MLTTTRKKRLKYIFIPDIADLEAGLPLEVTEDKQLKLNSTYGLDCVVN